MPPSHRRAALLGGTAALLSGLVPGVALARPRVRTPDDDGSDDPWYSGPRRAGDDPYGPRYGSDLDPYGDDPFYRTRPVGRQPADPFGRGDSLGQGASLDTAPPLTGGTIDYRRAYAALGGEPFPVPAIRWQGMNPAFLRQEVAYAGREEPGTIVVDPNGRHLYFVAGDGRAMRYGVGVGRQGFAWSGTATVNSKQEWPDWYPPKEMIERDPHLARSLSELQSGVGMAGGPRNPLGARALYLWQGNRDTLYRIHGTTEPGSIGTRASSGCIRMINQDAIDLYARVSVGSRVVVLG